MIPQPSTNLGLLAERIMTQTLADLKSEYVMSDTGMVAMLLMALQSELAQGIDSRMVDISSMKALFRQAQDQVDDSALTSELAVVLELEPQSLKMADVNELHDKLTRVLIQLHDHVQDQGLDDINAAIWRYLEEHAGRHVLEVPI